MSKKMSITRTLKLAQMYGFSARFTPGGNEADEAAKAAGTAEFDKVRQQAQQHEANATKARNEATAVTTQLNETKGEVEALKSQLAAANAKAESAGIDVELNEDDYSDTDVALVRSIKALNAKIDLKDAVISGLQKDASDFKESKLQEQATAAQETQYQELLNDMDVDYGPEYRNAAVTAFEKLNAEGKVTGGPAKATRILEKCYKNAVKAVKDKEAETAKGNVRLDSGSGGGTSTLLSGVELKSGSLEDVTAQAGKLLNKSG